MSTQYDSKSIQSMEKLDHIRLRPTGYVTDTEIMGQWHIAKELIDNSIDELELLGKSGILTVAILRDLKADTYQMIVRDNGRGVPLGSLLDVFTKLHTSGKFNTDSYLTSSGSFGIGAKATAGLSKFFRAISERKNGIGDVFVKEGVAPDAISKSDTKQSFTGTTVIYEPDPSIFSSKKGHEHINWIPVFMNEGYGEIIKLLKKFSLFSSYQIQFKIANKGVSADFWKKDAPVALDEINDILSKAEIVYDNFVDQKDNDEYLRGYFGLVRPWAWKHKIFKSITGDKTLGFDIFMYGVQYDHSGGHMALLNSVPIDDPSSSHITQFRNSVKRELVNFIPDTKMKNYFLNNYKLPIYFAMSVKYSGAEFTGTTKHAFRDSEFSIYFGKQLRAALSTGDSKKALAEFFELLKEDIEASYIQFTTGTTKVKNTKRLLTELNNPHKFNDCSTTDRSKAELFLTEGDSANSNEGRDSEFQATYSLRGKPYNAITTPDHHQDAIVKLQANDIFEDLLKITGLTPTMTDFSKLRYGKIFVMTDADSHGGHIRNIIIGNFMEYNPKFIEAGILHTVAPPLYGLKLRKGGSKDSDTIYIRTADELINALAEFVFYPALKVEVIADGVFDKGRELTLPEFVEFVRIVYHVGGTIDRLSKEHVIDPLILEQLTYVSHYLSPVTMDIDVVREKLNIDSMDYDERGNVLRMSLGRQDIIISLHDVADSMYRELLPFLRKICWDKWAFRVSTRYTTELDGQIMSIVSLYNIFESLKTLFKIKRYKGLGSMKPKARAMTCMDPKCRVVEQITTVGNPSRVYELLGSDSTYRKELLETKDI